VALGVVTMLEREATLARKYTRATEKGFDSVASKGNNAAFCWIPASRLGGAQLRRFTFSHELARVDVRRDAYA